MLDHLSIPVANMERSTAFYDAVLRTLGLVRRKERPGAVGYGPASRKAPVFWILAAAPESASPGVGLHVSFQAETREQVDDFHRTAIACGARDAGPPGPRPEYTQPFYGAFVFDPDGFKVEAVCRRDDG